MKRAITCSLLLLFVFLICVPAQQDEPGFNVTVQAVSVPAGRNLQRHGLIVSLKTDDRQVVGFLVEVSYRQQGSMFREHQSVWCSVDYGGHGGMYLWVGQVLEPSALAWEIKGVGRTTESTH